MQFPTKANSTFFTEGGDQDADGEEDKECANPIPSAVAQRTRLKTKPAVTPSTDKDDSDGESADEVPKGPPSRKRKIANDAKDVEGGDDAATKKKPKPAPKKPAKGKAAAKKVP